MSMQYVVTMQQLLKASDIVKSGGKFSVKLKKAEDSGRKRVRCFKRKIETGTKLENSKETQVLTMSGRMLRSVLYYTTQQYNTIYQEAEKSRLVGPLGLVVLYNIMLQQRWLLLLYCVAFSLEMQYNTTIQRRIYNNTTHMT